MVVSTSITTRAPEMPAVVKVQELMVSADEEIDIKSTAVGVLSTMATITTSSVTLSSSGENDIAANSTGKLSKANKSKRGLAIPSVIGLVILAAVFVAILYI